MQAHLTRLDVFELLQDTPQENKFPQGETWEENGVQNFHHRRAKITPFLDWRRSSNERMERLCMWQTKCKNMHQCSSAKAPQSKQTFSRRVETRCTCMLSARSLEPPNREVEIHLPILKIQTGGITNV